LFAGYSGQNSPLQPDMASHNANGNGGLNGDFSRGAYSGRYRSRPHPRGNNRRPEFPDNIFTSVNGQIFNEGQHSQEAVAIASAHDGSVPSSAPKPRRGRGFSGPSRNVYRGQSQGNHQFSGDNQRQGYSLRNDSNYVQNQPLNTQSRNQFSQNDRLQQTQVANLSEIQSGTSQDLLRIGKLRDSEVNNVSLCGQLVIFSNFSTDLSQVYNRSTDNVREFNQQQNTYSERGISTRPKQNRAPKKQPFRNPQYKNHSEQSENSETVADSYATSSFASPSVSTATSNLEHQPYENIRKEYTRYKGRPTFEGQYEGSNGNRNSQDRYRRDERSGAYGSQEKFYRDESSGSYASRDRFKSDEPVRASTSSNRDQVVFSKPTRTYDSHNWRSEGFKKGLSVQKQKASEVMADTATQRERLTTQLTSGTYECMVCCESVKPVQVFKAFMSNCFIA
jgi:hypothetical protein